MILPSRTEAGLVESLEVPAELTETRYPSDMFRATETPAETTPTPFMIDSEDRANWYLRKKGNLAAERERIKANAAAMLADVKREEDSLDSRFGKQFEQWAKDELIRRKAKTKKLPLFQGVVSFRRVNASYFIADPEAAFQYARTFLPEMIETKLILNGGTYIEASKASRETETLDKETGEMVPGNVFPGTEIKPEYESMSIKFVAPVGAIDADEAEDGS